MTTLTGEGPHALDPTPVARVSVDDGSVEVFLPDAEHWRVVIATMDEHRRPAIVGRWEPQAGYSGASSIHR